MILERVTAGPFETNAYLVGCPSTRKAFVVDAPPGSAHAILKKAKDLGLELQNLFLTHSHWDHIADAESLGLPTFVHVLDVDNLRKPGSDLLPLLGSMQGMEPQGFLQDKQQWHVGELVLEVITTAGHTPGSVCLYLAKEKTLFSGDTLFKGTMGRVDFPLSNPRDMWDSLKKLATLPPDTKVFPGHGPSTEIGREERWMVQAKERFGR